LDESRERIVDRLGPARTERNPQRVAVRRLQLPHLPAAVGHDIDAPQIAEIDETAATRAEIADPRLPDQAHPLRRRQTGEPPAPERSDEEAAARDAGDHPEGQEMQRPRPPAVPDEPDAPGHARPPDQHLPPWADARGKFGAHEAHRQSPSVLCQSVSAATAAVSALSTRGPSVTGRTKGRARNRSASAGANP